MSHPFGPKSLAIVHHLAKHGNKNRLELERELGMAQLSDHISKLRRGGHITSLPKERGELMRYQITSQGRGVIGAHIQRQESMRHSPLSARPMYVPKDAPVRSGSMDAYRLPSRGIV